MTTTDTFDPSTVAPGDYAPDGTFADVPLNSGTAYARLPGKYTVKGPLSITPHFATFKREVASSDEGTNHYRWQRVG